MIKRGMLLSAMVLVCILASLALGGYTLRVNGVDIGESLILEVGQSVTIGVYSDSLTPVATEPTGASAYLKDGCWILGWDIPSYGSTRTTFTNMVVNTARTGPDGTGWTNTEPDDAVANIGWALGSTPVPVQTGIWWQCTFTANAAGAVKLGLGTYNPGYTVWTEFDKIDVTILPATPPSQTQLIAQWDGDHVAVINGNQVTNLWDQTVNGYHMDQGWEEPNNYRPLLVTNALNGHDVLDFNGGQFMEYNPVDPCDPKWTDAGNYTWFILLKRDYFNPTTPYTEDIFASMYQDTDPNTAGDQYGGWGNRVYDSMYGGQESRQVYSHVPSCNGKNGGFAEEYSQIWGAATPEWTVITGVWDDPNVVTVNHDVDGYSNYARDLTWFADQDNFSTNKLSTHLGCFLGMKWKYLAGGAYDYYFNGQIAEVRVYRGAMTPAQVADEVQAIRVKYGLESNPDCTDMTHLTALVENWLGGGYVTWEDDMSVDPKLDGDWAVRGTAGGYTMSGGKMILTSTAFSTLLDTKPRSNFDCQTDVTLDFRATSNTTKPGYEGIGLWVNVGDSDNPPYGNLLFEVHRTSTTAQEVRVWDTGQTPNVVLKSFSGFNTNMIHLDATIDLGAHTITVHSASDGTLTFTNQSFAFVESGTLTGYPWATIAALGEAGEVDYVRVHANKDLPAGVDRNGDCQVDLEDFAPLASLWNPPCN